MSTTPWTFDGESTLTGGSVTLVDGSTFLVCDPSGDIAGHGPQGLFMLDTRVLSSWRLTIDGEPVQPLSVIPNGPFSATFVGRVIDPKVADAPATVIQSRHLGHGMREDIEIRHFGAEPVTATVGLRIGADFGGLFDVKAGRETGWNGPVTVAEDGAITISADPAGPEGGVDSLVIRCLRPPESVEGDRLLWWPTLRPGETWHNCFLVGVTAGGTALEPTHRCGEAVHEAIPMARLRNWRDRVTRFETDDAELGAALGRAAEDLGALRIFDADHPERVVVAAGAPWFMTLFGRDSLIASWMALPLDRELAEGVLLELADAQGVKHDARSEEQPGRILHEVRFDADATKLLGGSGTYYGTVDATPLFVMLVAELARWTGPTPTVVALMPAVDRALEWVERFGDRDGDGFVEYLRSDSSGLENQGWKDSWDGVRHRNGDIATGPIALCEVQGYVYAAQRGRAELARILDEPAEISRRFDRLADELRQRFDERFWLESDGWYAIGLDGAKQTIGSLTSNIGHLLWTGIVPEHRAGPLADRLVDPSMFTGWGLRTLSADNRAFNPLSYHCGSVWPHDTALAVAGLYRYGFHREASVIARGLLRASARSGGRLPELFAGFARDDLPAPIPYPASCSPQAWAAASPLLLARAMLGLDPDVPNNRLHLRPRLPAGVHRLRFDDVSIGGHRVSISVDADGGVEVTGTPPGMRVEIDRE